MVAAVLHLHESAGMAGKRVDRDAASSSFAAMMSPTATRDPSLHDRASSFSSLPSTRSTSGMAAKVSGADCAAQPVTTMRRSGCSRLMRRIVCFAWRTASAVTAQVLITTASVPSADAPDHFRLHDIEPAAEGDDLDAHGATAFSNSAGSNFPANSNCTGPVINTWPSLSRQSMVSSPPGSVTFTLRLRAPEPRGGNGSSTGGRAAGLGQIRRRAPRCG